MPLQGGSAIGCTRWLATGALCLDRPCPAICGSVRIRAAPRTKGPKGLRKPPAAPCMNGRFGGVHREGRPAAQGREQRICPVMVPRNAAEWRSVAARLLRPEVQTGVIQATAIGDGIERLRDVGPIATIAEKIPHAEKG